MSLSTVTKTVGIGLRVGSKFVIKHLPTLLTALGSMGVVAGTVMAAKQTPEAKVEFDEAKAEWEAKPEAEKTSGNKADYIFRIVKIGSKYYLLVGLVIAGSIICFWVANHINLKRIAVLSTGLAATSEQLKDLEKKVREKDGDKALQKMKDEINSEKLKEAQIDPSIGKKLNMTIGECVIWDPIMKHPSAGTAEQVRRATAMVKEDLTEQLMGGEKYAFVCHSDFLSWCGFDIHGPVYDSDAGEYLGFGVNAPNDLSISNIHALVDDAVDISWTADMLDGEIPVLALKYGNPPKYQIYNWGTL